jgi:uncharacterized BrkB/YihY/UPF0761 family membrane protein
MIGMLWTVAKEATGNWSSHKDARQGAALAYYSVFSLGPIIVIAIAVAGFFFGRERSRDKLLHQSRICSATRAQKRFKRCWQMPDGLEKAWSRPF